MSTENNTNTVKLAGFVLLSECVWSKNNFTDALRADWGISVEEKDAKSEDMLVAQIDDCILAAAFIPAPVPNGEAEHYAAGNYMWKEAKETVSRHKAQIILSVLGEGSYRKKAELYTKAAASLLKQENAIALYSDGAVYQPEFFIDFSSVVKSGEFPVMNNIWFGLFRNEGKMGIYTYGMRKFGFEEMEVSVPDGSGDLNHLRQFLFTMAVYVLSGNVQLHDGETIGFSEKQKLAITLSKGIAVDGDTLKIEYGEE